jgi:serine/threonine protein kinase
VLYILLTGSPPFGKAANAFDHGFALFLREPAAWWQTLRNYNEEAVNLLRKLLQIDPRLRPSMVQVCSHAWVVGSTSPPTPTRKHPLPPECGNTQRRRRRPKHAKYNVVKSIGKGSFGVVYHATCDETYEAVALKRMTVSGRHEVVSILREIRTLRKAHHPAVVKLLDVQLPLGGKTIDLVQSLCQTDLHTALQVRKTTQLCLRCG